MILDVIIPLSIPMPHLSYSYQGVAQIGARVVVPLGKTKRVVGIVTAIREQGSTDEKFREIITLLDTNVLINQHSVELYKFISQYYLSLSGDVLRSLVPATILSESFEPKSRLMKSRFKKSKPTYLSWPQKTVELTKPTTLIQTSVEANYLEIIASHCQCGGSVLILTPTHFQAEKIAAHLGQYSKTELYHPRISIKKRAEIFVNCAMFDTPQIIVGTRSAVGLPMKNLSLIVIVNEHSYAYKNGRAPRFSARDAALVLAAAHGAQTLLISQAPSVESYFNASTLPQWELISMEAHQHQKLKSIALEHGKDLISKYLQRRTSETLTRGKQVVIFQNRRGWSSMMTCLACGYTPSCPSCDCSLTLHKADGLLRCHSCGHSQEQTEVCPRCNRGQMTSRGRGTERLEQQISELYPSAAVVRLDSDNAHQYDEITEQFATQKADIIVGTQIIIDNIDFSNVGLIAIANADNLLSASDFRASEQAYRLIYLLAEQARQVEAELIVQTSSHNNSTIESAIDRKPEIFYRREIAEREQMHYPPFSRLVEIDMRATDKALLFVAAQDIERVLRTRFGTELSPLFQPPIERQSGKHIVKLLLKIDRSKSLTIAKHLIVELTRPLAKRYAKGVEIEFIVDPL